jgi:hypothetical protein
MTPLEYTITRYIEARSDAEHWQALCVDWLKTNGRGHSHSAVEQTIEAGDQFRPRVKITPRKPTFSAISTAGFER